MQQVRDLYHNSAFYFMLLAAAAVLAFWPTYFSVLRDAPLHAHAHGMAMSLWVLLLIGQALLIRSGRRELRLRVFPAMLAVFVVLQVPNFFVPATGWWAQFAGWYLTLPLP